MSKKQRIKNRETAINLYFKLPAKHKCINCGEVTHVGHYYPPVFGESGGWTCKNLTSFIINTCNQK